jgi:AhpD family alkylhydroperoxidase
MSARLKMGKVQPAAYQAMDALDNYVSETSVNKIQQELMRIRASQINGCGYCVNYHAAEALKLGESEKRLLLISVWRGATNVFTPEEQLLFAMTEEITLIQQQGLSDAVYDKAIETFGDEKTAQVMMVIITINAWNRIGVGLKMQPAI